MTAEEDLAKPARAMGQLYIDQQKDRLINDAASHGWVPLGRDPLILSRGDKRIEIDFNGGGIPNAIKWLHGDEFPSMRSTGYVDLNELYRWFAWKPEGND